MRVQLLNKNATMPTRGSVGAAGLDLYASETITIRPRSRLLVKTDIAVAIPFGQVGLIWPRSKLASKKHIDVKAGCIDSDYRGEVMVLLANNHPFDCFPINKGDRIAQILIQLVDMDEPFKVNSLHVSDRGREGILSEEMRA